jgi:DNA-binding PadR family transcriptional regulator
MKFLARSEELVLLAIWKLDDKPYGVNIRKFLSEMTEHYWSIGSVYVPLDRLENKGFVESYLADPTPKRGGKSKRYYKLTDEGVQALKKVKKIYDVFWKNVPEFSE